MSVQSCVTGPAASLATWTMIKFGRYPGGRKRPGRRHRCWVPGVDAREDSRAAALCEDRPVRRPATVAGTLLVPALLHISAQHRFHGPPFDYWALGVAAAASWVGVPGPGEPVLIAAGVLAARHELSLGPVLLVAWVAATIGGIVGWAIGMKAGRAVLTAPGPVRPWRIKAAVRGEQLFGRYPVVAVLLTPSWIAGINRVRSRIYQPTNALSAAAWAVGFGLGGFLLGPAVIDFGEDLGTVTTGIAVTIVVVLVVVELVRRRRRAGP
ncbi:MAG: hypothetical protein WAK93_03505 [Solirubrobacteraceae bacterium]